MQRMQQTSLVHFCDECGFANRLDADECAACQSPLARINNIPDEPQAVEPVKIVSTPVLEVTPGTHFATALPDVPREFKRGTLLKERYYIQAELGRGGFSTVYHAVDLKQSEDNGGEVAIKRIQLSALTPRQVIDATETFNREITMLARFKGIRGIPRFYEQLTDPENWYLIMEYVKGRTLEEYLQKKRKKYLPEYRVIEIGINLARILHELHKSNPPVIFRDIKPANIMFTPAHNLYLIDFGIARNYTPGKAKDTIRLGSPGYAPPEQYGSAQTDQRSDIYSLGATLQTLLTGRDPLDLRAGEASLNPKALSPGLRALLDQTLDSDPERRPIDMELVQESLKDIQTKFWSRHHFQVSFGLGLAWGVIIGSVLLAFLEGRDWATIFYLFCLSLGLVSSCWQGLRKARNLSKVSRRPFVYGILTAVVLFLLIVRLLLLLGWPL